MRRLLDRIPTQDDLYRHRGKIAGLAAGLLAPLVLAALVTVVYTGHGLWVDPPRPPVVYPGL